MRKLKKKKRRTLEKEVIGVWSRGFEVRHEFELCSSTLVVGAWADDYSLIRFSFLLYNIRVMIEFCLL